MERPANTLLVIFGASGDLTRRKLMPELFALFQQNMMPEQFVILGAGRTALSGDEFRQLMLSGIQSFSGSVPHEPERVAKFLSHVSFHTMDTNDGTEYTGLKQHVEQLAKQAGDTQNILFYLATPPNVYGTIPAHLASVGLHRHPLGYRRLIVEKPFGYDLDSARRLNESLLHHFKEDQIYRIDHYLGKETVQNILVTRFSNGVFEPLWNRNYVRHIEITSAESIGVEKRGAYYDNSGALRDMVQNHLLQLTALVAMEPPSSFEAEGLRNETMKVFQSLRPIAYEDVPKYAVRGQYTESKIRGEKAAGYRQELGVPAESMTETFVALKFFIDNWRWGGVPFYLRTGKRLPTRVTEIVVHFKPTPHHLFQQSSSAGSDNVLVIRIQPDEGLLLKIGMKVPGQGFRVQKVNMDFHYKDLSDAYVPSAYERLLFDAMSGDSTLYTRGDALEACWKFIAPIQKAWKENKDVKMFGYPSGSWGPEHVDDLIEGDDYTWRYPCKNLSDDGIFCEL